MTSDKQQMSYENAPHPLRSSFTIKYTQPLLLNSAKASAALLERKSQFAQRTMQKPLGFVGKVFHGSSDNSSTSSQSRPDGGEYNKERDEEDDNNDVTEYDHD
jgi:hypothetical protein